MERGLTYEVLKKKVKELEKEAAKRRYAENALMESEERYRMAVEHSNDGVAILKGDNHVFVNQKFVEIFGYNVPDDIVGKPVWAFVHSDDRKRVTEINRQRQKGKQAPTRYECKGVRKDGGTIDLEVSATKTMYRGEPVSLVFLREVTERKLAEEAVREREAHMRAVLDASIDRIRYVDKDMRIIWGNKTTAMVHGMSPEDIVGKLCHKIFVGRDNPCQGCPTVKARETGKTERALIRQTRVKGIEGETFWDTYCVPLMNKSGKIEGYIQVARNITDQKLAEDHIHALTQQLMKAQESERQMISRELHDRVAQDLSTLKIGCDTLFDDNPEVVPELRKKALQLSEILHKTIMTIRDLTYDLRPPSLDQLGLVSTVYQYCEDFAEQSGLSVDFHSAGMDNLQLDSNIEINVYRLIQEGLNNIKKHAKAKDVFIRLVASSPNVILRIEDDGRGFDVEERMARISNEKRMVLRNMEERVRLLQGRMFIQSRPTRGTKILIEFPYKERISG
jgi:PAS domain S-box-containing protein